MKWNGANEFQTKAEQKKKKKKYPTAMKRQYVGKYEWIDRLWQVKYLVYLFHRCDNPSYLNHKS